MKSKIFVLGLSALAVFSTSALAQNKCLPENQITPAKVKDALKPIVGNINVVSVESSPVNGLFEAVIENNGKKIPIYIDCTLNYLISGELIDIKARKSLTREKVAQLNKQTAEEKFRKLSLILGKEKAEKLKQAVGENTITRMNIVNLDNLPSNGKVVYGNPDGKLNVYVITDPECPFCKRLHEQLKEVIKHNPDVKFTMIMFPLPFHKNAKGVASAVVCENSNDKAKKLLDRAFEKQEDKSALKDISKKSCKKADDILEEHMSFAKQIGVKGTPTMVFDIGNNKGITISGALPANQVEDIINAIK